MKKLTKLSISLFALLTLFVGASCIDTPVYTSPRGYDLNRPIKYYMTESLKEISGIAFHNGNSDILYTEQDEAGKVYYFPLGSKNVKQSTFGKPGDFEDIAILNEQVIMLRSDGVFFVFPFNQVQSPNIAGARKWDDILPQGEYEGLYADNKTNQVYALCKHCEIDKKTTKTNTGYIFKLSPNGNLKQAGQFVINVQDVEAMMGEQDVKFHPSAITKNPVTNEWYILSSVNKVLVVLDAGWKVKAVHPLNPSLFIQPEGIAFDNQNNLYISNEGDKITPGTVYKFNYKK
jgi:hypothetical protein